jgi:hypothetical protein
LTNERIGVEYKQRVLIAMSIHGNEPLAAATGMGWLGLTLNGCGDPQFNYINELVNKREVYFILMMDVQGAELQVLKSLGSLLNNVLRLRTEISLKPFYVGGVLFDELHPFIVNAGFKLQHNIHDVPEHGDVLYVRVREGDIT